MHTLQLLLVSAEDHEAARANVNNAIYPDYAQTNANWSDWSEASENSGESFAGRWSSENRLGEKAENDTLRYSDDPDTADRIINEFLKDRADEIFRLRSELNSSPNKDALYTYDPDPMEYYKFPHELWTILSITNLLADRWTSNSGVYDVDDFTGSVANFYKKVDTDPTQVFLVLVDFHY
jgi:hypothetical protein